MKTKEFFRNMSIKNKIIFMSAFQGILPVVLIFSILLTICVFIIRQNVMNDTYNNICFFHYEVLFGHLKWYPYFDILKISLRKD